MCQVLLAEQQELLQRVLRRVPALETRPVRVQAQEKGGGGGLETQSEARSVSRSKTAHFKFPTDPLWPKQWSLVRGLLSWG